MKERYVKPLLWSFMILLVVGYVLSVQVILRCMLKFGKELAYEQIRESVLRVGRTGMPSWNFTGTPIPLEELWPIR